MDRNPAWRQKPLCVFALFALIAVVTPCLAQSDAVKNWMRLISIQLERQARYPPDAHGQDGEAKVRFTLDRSGGLISAEILKSSDDPSLDAAAIEIVKSAAPFPPVPAEIDDLKFTIPVVFNPRGRPSRAGDPAIDPNMVRQEQLLQSRMRGICRGC